MISIEVDRNEASQITLLRVSGHAAAAEEGHDVVCAAVSALAQTAALGLTERLGLEVSVQIRRGFLTLHGPRWTALGPAESLAAAVLLDTVVLALEQLARQHPDYVHITRVQRRSRREALGSAGK